MKTRLHQCLALLLGIATLSSAAAAGATRIEGLSAFTPVSAHNAAPVVADGTLQIRLPDAGMLTVAPWPKFLPQNFGKQSVTGVRHMHPAGPVDRLSFSRDSEPSPWLMLGNAARRSTVIIENWKLQLAGRRWSVSDGKTRKILRYGDDAAKPAMVSVGADRWCIYLLDSDIPAGNPGIATEAEPQIGWAAIRLSPLQRKCSVRK